jgi:hypothetical protein
MSDMFCWNAVESDLSNAKLFPYCVMSCVLAEKDEDHSLICCLVRAVALLSSCDRSMANNDRMVTVGR